MQHVMSYIMQPYSEDPDKLERILELEEWDENVASVKAMKEGVLLTYDHWNVVEYLQDYYLRNGWPDSARVMARKLDREFSEQGGKRFLYTLFPKAPLKQAARIAGLPAIRETGSSAHGYEL
ncbi:MAG: TusE/DsrC/DsvC family sulfur relay protein [Gammaproteobacteria bacterium]|nr:TusE/DsrC/DsvC family sulfur relay protein [Gammaproteobacteria bacterium]